MTIHPKAMPVILTSPGKFDLWLEGRTPEGLKLQRPWPDTVLKIVAKGVCCDQCASPKSGHFAA
jgi:hypothetical protein